MRWVRLQTMDLTGIDIMVNAADNIAAETRVRPLPFRACCGGWWPPGTWAERPGRASTRY